jgi:hypothetical protein
MLYLPIGWAALGPVYLVELLLEITDEMEPIGEFMTVVIVGAQERSLDWFGIRERVALSRICDSARTTAHARHTSLTSNP